MTPLPLLFVVWQTRAEYLAIQAEATLTASLTDDSVCLGDTMARHQPATGQLEPGAIAGHGCVRVRARMRGCSAFGGPLCGGRGLQGPGAGSRWVLRVAKGGGGRGGQSTGTDRRLLPPAA